MSAGDLLVDDLLDDDLYMLSNMFEGIDDNHRAGLGLHDNAVNDHDNTDILSRMAYDVTRNFNKADNVQQWIPTEMSDPLFLNGFKISKQYSICCKNGERVGGCLRPNTAEEQLIFGCGGILPRAMGLFNRSHGRYKESITITNSGAKWEKLEDFYCGGLEQGCRRLLRVYRVRGGIFVFEKVDGANEVTQHDLSTHNERLSGVKGFALTVAQKNVVLQLHGKKHVG